MKKLMLLGGAQYLLPVIEEAEFLFRLVRMIRAMRFLSNSLPIPSLVMSM